MTTPIPRPWVMKMGSHVFIVERERDKEYFTLTLSEEVEQGYYSPVTLPCQHQDEVVLSMETPHGPGGYPVLKLIFKWKNKPERPACSGVYLALVEEQNTAMDKRDKAYHFPCWKVVEWDGLTWRKEGMCLSESQSGYNITMEDVSERVISWMELPEWFPTSLL